MTYTQDEHDRLIGLAAVMQATYLVHNIAVSGQADDKDILPLLNSLLITEADDAASVYGGLSNLTTGLEQLHTQLTQIKSREEVTQIQYAVRVLKIERKLAKIDTMMDIVSDGIGELPDKLDHFESISHPSVVAYIADIYKRSISNITPFIEIHGEEQHLTNNHNANLIRSLLLTAVRGAILWHQKGGRLRHLVWQSKKLTKMTESVQASL